MLNHESGDKYDQTVIPLHHWSFLFFHSSLQTLKAEDLESSHVREHFFSNFFPRQHSGRLTRLFLAVILHRKGKLDHMLVPIKTLAVGIQELHHKSWKSLNRGGNSCIKDHFYNTWLLYVHIKHFKCFFLTKLGLSNCFCGHKGNES